MFKPNEADRNDTQEASLSGFWCWQVKQDAQVYQDYQGRTLFKFRTMCKSGMQVCLCVYFAQLNLFGNVRGLNVHVTEPCHLFSPSLSGGELVGRRKRDRRQAGRG